MSSSTHCNVCSRDPKRMNSDIAECSHIQCPHRRTAWSERPTPADLFKGPWPKREREGDPRPLDRAEELTRAQREARERAEKMPRVCMAGRECIDTGRIVIGRAYLPPPAPMFSQAEHLQAALLDPRTARAQRPLQSLIGRLWAWC